MSRPRIDLVKLSPFGHWTVLYHVEGMKWHCRCVCGTERDVIGHLLRRGTSQSCGCLRLVGVEKRGRNRALRMYKYWARKRELEWSLSDEKFDSLIKSPCIYCGLLPSNSTTESGGKFVYSGIDRVKSELGYIPENVVSCCKVCNRMKSNMSYADFVAWVKRVSTNLKGALVITGPRVGVATIVLNAGRNVLLGRSTKECTKGQWIIPGGGIKYFESIKDTSTREIKEETGIEVGNQEMLFVSEKVNPPDEHRLVIYVSGQATGGVLRSNFTEEDELSEVRWVDPRDLGFYQHEMSDMTIDAFFKYSQILKAKALRAAWSKQATSSEN